MKAAKMGCSLGLLSLAGAVSGFIISIWIFALLFWGFPDNWKQLNGLPEGKPQSILALDAQQETFLLRMEDGALYTCVKQDCQSETTDWSADFPCGETQRPALTGYLPLLVFKNLQPLLACERGYLDIARTAAVAQADGTVWVGGGIGMLPTDAAAAAAGVVGAATGLISALIVGGLILLIRAIANQTTQTRKQSTHAH